MRATSMKMFVWGFLAAVTLAASGGAPLGLDYEIRNPRGWVYLASGRGEQRVRGTAGAASGDLVRTAWFSGTDIDVPSRRVHFSLGPRARARLAEGTPGVLLELERGRLRAVFDKLMGDDSERLVTTPGAIVAVRGTRLGIAVNSWGDTTLAVFEGIVEVRARSGIGASVFVPAGASSEIPFGGPPEPPVFRPLEEENWEGFQDPAGRSGENDREDATATQEEREEGPNF